MGEDIGVYGGAFQVTGDLVERFGEERVMDTPISELGGAGVAVGAALTGMRPVYEFQFSDFSMLAMEQIVNQAAKLRFMLGGAVNVPVVFRMPTGSGLGGGRPAQPEHRSLVRPCPGPEGRRAVDAGRRQGPAARGDQGSRSGDRVRAQAALQDEGATPEGYYETPLDRAVVRREGRDLTIVAAAIMVHRALEAAEILAKEGIEAEVIDLRLLQADRQGRRSWPASRRRGGLLCGLRGRQDARHRCGNLAPWSPRARRSTISTRRSCGSGGVEAPIPYNPVLEKAAVPQTDDIVAAARRLALAEV